MDEVTVGVCQPSPTGTYVGGTSDGDDGGDGCLQTHSSTTRGNGEARTTGARSETLQDHSGPDSQSIGDDAAGGGVR